MKEYYSLFVDLQNRPCVVIGGGKVAERKIDRLLKSGAKVTVISPQITKKLAQYVEKKQLVWLEREYETKDLIGFFLVVIATDQSNLNQMVYHEVNHQIQLVNIVDDPDLCTFIVPSTVKRGHLQISISTQGASPGLAKKIRREIETTYGIEYVEYTKFLAEMREWILTQDLDVETRQFYFAKLLEEQMFERIKEGDPAQMITDLKQEILEKRMSVI